jgi:hypothetical protein
MRTGDSARKHRFKGSPPVKQRSLEERVAEADGHAVRPAADHGRVRAVVESDQALAARAAVDVDVRVASRAGNAAMVDDAPVERRREEEHADTCIRIFPLRY